MSTFLPLLNSAMVGLYGSLLAASFCQIDWNRKNKLLFCGGVLLMAIIQALLYTSFGEENLREAYPLITHLPLSILLWYLSRNGAWSLISVFTAYLCCQLRRWIALLLVSLLQGDGMMQEWIEIFLTIPLLFLIFLFASPAIRSLSVFPTPLKVQFGILPTVGYVFDYLTRIYTDWLTTGAPVATEFMLFVCALAQLVFARYSNTVMKRMHEEEQSKVVLNLQLKQSVTQIEEMQKSQKLAAEYRHDLRHHLQYISACIENNRLADAQAYIKTLNDSVLSQTVVTYCENTAANLILSSFASAAQKAEIGFLVKLHLEEALPISTSDLCVLLSNALENALHACIEQKMEGNAASITVRGYQKNSTVFLEITNSCTDHIPFSKGVPITRQKGHGIGVKSICSIVDKYHGVYHFEVKDAHFILRVSL